MSKISYDLTWNGGADSDGELHLYLIPDGPQVYLWHCVGGGEPGPAWNGLWLWLGRISKAVVVESLQERLEGQEELLETLCGCYQGSEWRDGNNWGSWSDEAADLASYRLDLECDTFWTVDEWYGGGDFEGLEGEETVEEAAEREVERALDAGAHLDLRDVEAYIVEWLAKRRLQMRLDDGVWCLHNPETGADEDLWDEAGEPFGEGEFVAARDAAMRDYPEPNWTIVLV